MFATEPHKRRPGYANFEVADPPLKLVLFENPDAGERLNHLGVEVQTPDDVVASTDRFTSAGLDVRLQTAELCCHAVQDKVWTDAPDGEWEFYTILDDEPTAGVENQSTCCS